MYYTNEYYDYVIRALGYLWIEWFLLLNYQANRDWYSESYPVVCSVRIESSKNALYIVQRTIIMIIFGETDLSLCSARQPGECVILLPVAVLKWTSDCHLSFECKEELHSGLGRVAVQGWVESLSLQLTWGWRWNLHHDGPFHSTLSPPRYR